MKPTFPLWMRAIAVTLFIAMVYYFAGYRLVYSFIIHGAQEDAAFAIQHKQGTIKQLNISSTEYSLLKWTEKDKEFSLNEQLYDVVSIQKTLGKYVLTVYCDKNETMWVKALHDVIEQIFPAHQSKDMNHAESLSAAFQKEYKPLATFKVESIPEVKTLSYPHADSKLSAHPVKPIWHPPATSFFNKLLIAHP